MKLNYSQLQHDLKKKISPIYLISGDEPLQLGEAADSVRNYAHRSGYINREVISVETGFDWGQLMQSTETCSIFSDKKIIDLRLNSGKPGQEGAKVLINYCQKPSEDVLLLISSGRLDQSALKSKWCKAIESAGVILQVWPLKGADLIKWLQQRALKRGLQMDNAALKLLALRSEGNLVSAAQEIEKLYVQYGAKVVAKREVEQSVVDSSRFDVFGLVDSLLVGKINKANKILNGLRAEGVVLPVVVWALAKEIRLLIQIKTLIQNGEAREGIFKKLKIWDKKKQLLSQAEIRIGKNQLNQALSMCSKADRQAKGIDSGDGWETLFHVCLYFNAK